MFHNRDHWDALWQIPTSGIKLVQGSLTFVSAINHDDANRETRDALESKMNRFVPEFNGILAGYGKLRVLENASVSPSTLNIRYELEGTYYIFMPNVGDILTGEIIKKERDSLTCLVHKQFEVFIPVQQDFERNPKLNEKIKIPGTIEFQIKNVNFNEDVPRIVGNLLDLSSRGMDRTQSTSKAPGRKTRKPTQIKILFKKKKKGKKSKVKERPSCCDENLDDITWRILKKVCAERKSLVKKQKENNVPTSMNLEDMTREILEKVSRDREKKQKKAKFRNEDNLDEMANQLFEKILKERQTKTRKRKNASADGSASIEECTRKLFEQIYEEKIHKKSTVPQVKSRAAKSKRNKNRK